MDPTDSFMVRWENFEKNTADFLKKMRVNSEFCDVTISCEGNQVEAHQVVLGASSPFIQQILKENPHPHPSLLLEGVKHDHLLSVMDFIYTGQTYIVKEELNYFVEVANYLKIEGLINIYESKETSVCSSDSFVKEESGSQTTLSLPHSIKVSHTADEESKNNIKLELSDDTNPEDSFEMSLNSGYSQEEMIDFIKTELPITEDDVWPYQHKPDSPLKLPKSKYPDKNGMYVKGNDLPRDFDQEEKVSTDITYLDKDWYEEHELVIDEQHEDVHMELDTEQGENVCDQVFCSIEKSSHNCTICGKSFRQKLSLKNHMLIWKGKCRSANKPTNTPEFSIFKKPFQCPDCPSKFSRKNELKIHKRIHNGEKPFQCLDCPKKFARKYDLKMHTKIHRTPETIDRKVLEITKESVAADRERHKIDETPIWTYGSGWNDKQPRHIIKTVGWELKKDQYLVLPAGPTPLSV